MRSCILDGEAITDKSRLHDILAESLELPDWYGRNLDALYDCLTDRREETRICILQVQTLERKLGGYVQLLLKVLRDAAEENKVVQLIVDGKNFDESA